MVTISPSQKSKLGDIGSFSLPAGKFRGFLICKGWSKFCKTVCYVLHGATFKYPTVRKAYIRNLEDSKRPDFVIDAISAITILEAKNIRKFNKGRLCK